MDHVFGPCDGPPGRGERLCNEPLVPNADIWRTYHLTFEMMSNGDFVCLRCGEHFLFNSEDTS